MKKKLHTLRKQHLGLRGVMLDRHRWLSLRKWGSGGGCDYCAAEDYAWIERDVSGPLSGVGDASVVANVYFIVISGGV